MLQYNKVRKRLAVELLVQANLKLSKLSRISSKLFKPREICSWNLVSEDKDTKFELVATVCQPTAFGGSQIFIQAKMKESWRCCKFLLHLHTDFRNDL